MHPLTSSVAARNATFGNRGLCVQRNVVWTMWLSFQELCSRRHFKSVQHFDAAWCTVLQGAKLPECSSPSPRSSSRRGCPSSSRSASSRSPRSRSAAGPPSCSPSDRASPLADASSSARRSAVFARWLATRGWILNETRVCREECRVGVAAMSGCAWLERRFREVLR